MRQGWRKLEDGPVRQAAGLSVLVFVLATGVLLPVSYAQYRRNEADLVASTQVQAVETASRLQREIEHHLRLLAVLRDSLESRRQIPIAAFIAEARVITRSWPAFQAVNWVAPDGRMLAVVPEAPNHPAVGMNILEVPRAAPAFRRALEGLEIAATAPLELAQGGRGVTTYLGVGEPGRMRGVINGVFRLEPLFNELVGGDLLERYVVRVTDGEDTVYSTNGESQGFRGVQTVRFGQRNWQLQLAPRAANVPDFAVQFRDESLAILAIALVAALLAGSLGYKQMSLRHTERRFRDLNLLLPDMVLECDEHRTLNYLNRRAQQVLGYTDSDLRAGLPLDALLGREDADACYAGLRDGGLPTDPAARICSIRCRDGGRISCELSLGAIRDEAGRFRGARVVLRDITERLEAEQAMNRLANFDPTTQLPNRSMFLQALGHEIRKAEVHGRRLVLVIIDLDNFKNINDRLGPSVGDLLLREAGQRLHGALRRQENVFRVSGDEFAMLFDSLAEREDIERMVRFLLAELRKPYRLGAGTEEIIDATAGISLYPDDAANSEQLYMQADAAVYEAKSEGGRRFRFFTREISRQLNERKQIEESLRHALRREEFRLVYQPVVDAASGKVMGVEALLRWQHPLKGLLTPTHFVPLAEETGLIDDIGAWVLQEACRQMRLWDAAGTHVPQVAVNVSAHQLESGVLDNDVFRALHDHSLGGERLVLELTESLLMRDVHFATRVLSGLKEHGVRIAVDDFGTGYSSLAYLNHLPIDTLKIDRAFIAPTAEPDGDTRVTEAVIALGRLLSLHIVAEGVEQAAQAQFLVEQGCSAMQGFHFCPPVSPGEIPALVLRDWRLKAGPRSITTNARRVKG